MPASGVVAGDSVLIPAVDREAPQPPSIKPVATRQAICLMGIGLDMGTIILRTLGSSLDRSDSIEGNPGPVTGSKSFGDHL